MPVQCEVLGAKATAYYNAAMVMNAYGYTSAVSFYYGIAQAYFDEWHDCVSPPR